MENLMCFELELIDCYFNTTIEELKQKVNNLPSYLILNNYKDCLVYSKSTVKENVVTLQIDLSRDDSPFAVSQIIAITLELNKHL